MIGLREEASALIAARIRPRASRARARTRSEERYGMPFGLVPKERPSWHRPRVPRGGRGQAARARERMESSSGTPARELHDARSCSTTPSGSGKRFDAVPGIDADAIVARLDDPNVVEAYERDKAEARTAAGTAAEAQGKTSTSDGPVRFTAPSVVFERRRASARRRRLAATHWRMTSSSRTSTRRSSGLLRRSLRSHSSSTSTTG